MKRHVVRAVLGMVGIVSVLVLSAAAPLHAASTAAPAAAAAYNDRSDPSRLLASYYNAINTRDYARAYGYWESPPNGASLEQFARGYINTKSVQFAITPPTTFDGAAGSVYASVPAVIIGTQIDNSIQTFAGCYTTRRSNIENTGWRIYGAKVERAANNASAAALLQRAAALCP